MPTMAVTLRSVFLVLAALGGTGLVTIWALRRRGLSPEEISRWRSKKHAHLTEVEFRRLYGWQRLVRVLFMLTIGFLVLFIGFISAAQQALSRNVMVAGYGILLGLVALGVLAQFGARCPRCGLNIGLQSSMGLPPYCERCHVTLRREAPKSD
jgi:hypothetical protein